MSWLRLDDGFTANPKIAALTDLEFRVWMRLLCYCARTQRPIVDELPRAEVNGLSAGRIRRFLELDLLVETHPKTHTETHPDLRVEINDWDAYNPPKDRTRAERAKRYRKRKKAETSRPASRVTSRVTDRDESRVTDRDDLARARVPVPSRDGTYLLEDDAERSQPPSSTPEVPTPANGTHTPDEVSLIEAAEQWIRAEAAHLSPNTVYTRLIDDFGIKWPDEQNRLVLLAGQQRKTT